MFWSSKHGYLVVGLVLAACPAPAPAAPVTPAREQAPRGEAPAERLRKALEQITDLDINDQSLELAIAQLREETKLNIVLDRVALAQMGIDVQGTTVNVKLQKVKLRSALRGLLAQHNLSFAVVGDTVLITTEDMAVLRQLRQRVSLDLDKVPLANAVKQLARETAVNLVIDARVSKESQAPVTLQLDDVPLETAVRLMAELAGLKPVRVGNVLFVTTKQAALELRADADLAPPTPGTPGVINEVILGGQRLLQPGGIAPPAPPVPVAPAEKPEPPAPAKSPDPANG